MTAKKMLFPLVALSLLGGCASVTTKKAAPTDQELLRALGRELGEGWVPVRVNDVYAVDINLLYTTGEETMMVRVGEVGENLSFYFHPKAGDCDVVVTSDDRVKYASGPLGEQLTPAALTAKRAIYRALAR